MLQHNRDEIDNLTDFIKTQQEHFTENFGNII